MRCCLFTLLAMAMAAVAVATEPEPTAKKPSPAEQCADEALLRKKLAELEQLQSEIRDLRKKLGKDQQLLIRIHMLEAFPKRFAEADEKREFSGASDEVQKRLTEWCQRRLVRVLAEPQLVTVIGRSASFHIGGQLLGLTTAKNSVPTDFGTRVDVVATAADDGTMRVVLRAHHSVLDYEHPVIVEGQTVPSLEVREVDTSARLLPDQTVVLASFPTEQTPGELPAEPPPPTGTIAATDSNELIVLVSVHLVDAVESASTANGGYGRAAPR
jgi:hypothetical protein